MAVALRFDSIKVNPSGTVEAFYTYGTTPLPAQPSGKGISFASRLGAVELKNAVIANFSEQTMLQMALAIYSIAASDPNLTGATALVGKTLTIDPTKPASVMVYG